MSRPFAVPFRLLRASVELGRLARQQWWDLDRLRALQWKRLTSIVRHAEEHSPFYRERFRAAGFSHRDLRDPGDLDRIPITGRRDLQEARRLLADGYDRGAVRRSRTSGSTGMPTTTYFDPWAWTLGKHVIKLRARLACGLRPTDRVAIFQEEVSPDSRTSFFGRRASFSVHRPPSEIVEDLRAFAPTALYGPPSHLMRLADSGVGLPGVRRIFTSAEMLDGRTRRRLDEAFGAAVMDVYGCTEVKEIAWQCPERDGYHINAEWLLVEIAEGDDRVPDGSILVTSLYNRAMPLIRYQVGDTGRMLAGGCDCGRGLPTMIPVLGRSVDYVRSPDGRTVSPYTLTCAVENVPGVRQYQIVQESEARVRVRVVPDEGFGDAGERAIQRSLAPVLPNVAVRVERVRHIPREPSGKFRIVRSDLVEPGE